MPGKKKNNSASVKGGGGTPVTAPSSPFFRPSTPHVVIVQQTPGGTRRQVTQKHEVSEHKSGLPGCAANLINAIVGSGIVGIPYAIRQSGFGAGVFLILFCAVLTEKSLRLLIATAKHVHVPSYETVAEAAYGTAGFRFIAANMFVMSYGAMLSYLMVVKESFSMMLGVDEDDLPRKRSVLLLVSASVMVPLSSQRDMADLAKTSRISVVVDAMLVALIAYAAPVSESLQRVGGLSSVLLEDTVHYDTVFIGLGVLSFAYVCQHSAFIIAGSLDTPTVSRWSVVTASALLSCSFLMIVCGVSGYLGFLDDTEGNVLMNLDRDTWAGYASRSMLGFTMLLVYPMESFVARHVCVVLLFSGRRAHDGEDASILNRRDRRIGLTVFLYVIAVVPALLFEDLGTVLAATGAVGGSCLSYIGPGVVYLGVHGGRFLELVRESRLFGHILASEEDNDQDQGVDGGYHASENSSRHSPSSISAYLNNSNIGRDDDKDEILADLAPPTLMVETTPLLASTTSDKIAAATSSSSSQQRRDGDGSPSSPPPPSMLLSAVSRIVWYGCGMPAWCYAAGRGRGGLTRHLHDMALKSPHPIRIGDVEYRRVPVTKHGYVDADPEDAAVLGGSSCEALPYLSLSSSERNALTSSERGIGTSSSSTAAALASPNLSLSGHGGGGGSRRSLHYQALPRANERGDGQHGVSINQLIGKEIIKQQQQQQQGQKGRGQRNPRQQQNGSNGDGQYEPDPQEDPPGWMDFVVAIFYILFGILALVVGLLSLASE